MATTSSARFDFTDDELRELQADYLSDVEEKVAQMKKHAADLAARSKFKSAFPVLLFLSHQLKGSGGSLGFPRVSELAAEASRELNDFLENETQRPSPDQLSDRMLVICGEIESAVTAARSA